MCAQNEGADTQVRPYGQKRAVCVGHEKVNWPEGPREAGLGRDLGTPCLPPTGGKVARRAG